MKRTPRKWPPTKWRPTRWPRDAVAKPRRSTPGLPPQTGRCKSAVLGFRVHRKNRPAAFDQAAGRRAKYLARFLVRFDQLPQGGIADRKHLEQTQCAQRGYGVDDVALGSDTLCRAGGGITPDLGVDEKGTDGTFANRNAIAFCLIHITGKKVFGSHEGFSIGVSDGLTVGG